MGTNADARTIVLYLRKHEDVRSSLLMRLWGSKVDVGSDAGLWTQALTLHINGRRRVPAPMRIYSTVVLHLLDDKSDGFCVDLSAPSLTEYPFPTLPSHDARSLATTTTTSLALWKACTRLSSSSSIDILLVTRRCKSLPNTGGRSPATITLPGCDTGS